MEREGDTYTDTLIKEEDLLAVRIDISLSLSAIMVIMPHL